MSEYIPLEVQEEILKRLPVKPLIQFRSVSKPWKSLIDSPEFIAAYGVCETQPNLLILRYTNIVESYYHGEERYIAFVDNDVDHSFIKQDFAPTVPDIIKKLESLSVVGSSHGLWCFNGGYYEYPDGQSSKYKHEIDLVVIWNPSVRKSVGIEVPYMYGSLEEINHVFGFGVCPITFDPTIVHIEYFSIRLLWKVGVFTLSSGTWSILSTTNLPRKSISLRKSQVVTNRFIYWVAFDELAAQDGIMSFDLTTKEFTEIDLTDILTSRLYCIQTISKLRESLFILAYHKEFEEDPWVSCLWMMNEKGVCRSVTKLYTINRPDTIIKTILGFRKTGELILKTYQRYEQDAELEIYDPNSEAIDNLGIDAEDHSFFMCSYMETVILLDQPDGFIYSISN